MKCIIPAEMKGKVQELLAAMLAVPADDGAFDRAVALFCEVTGVTTQTCFPTPKQSSPWQRLQKAIRSIIETAREWSSATIDLLTFEVEWAPIEPVPIPAPARPQGPRHKSSASGVRGRRS